jgi:hypothetical protein
MEKSISLTPWELSRAEPGALRGYASVYLGSEFCENKLPSLADLKKLRALHKGAVVVETSLLSNRGLRAAAALVKALSAEKKKFEIVVNDWGLLRLLKKDFSRFAVPLIGRLISWEIAEMDKKFLNAFCAEYKVRAIEADSPETLKRLEGLKIPVNFHYPLRFVSVTRFCPHTKAFNSAPCARACKGETLKLTNPAALPEPIYRRGNAYFAASRLPRHKSIARLVKMYQA